MRVVVIGGGFAGLIAADRIARSGQQFVVLEARNRVGGRIWSAELIPGDPRTVVERGGEFVLDGYDVMRSVLSDLDLSLADTGMSYYSRQPRATTPGPPGESRAAINGWQPAWPPGWATPCTSAVQSERSSTAPPASAP
jgi:monoamine oxidase